MKTGVIMYNMHQTVRQSMVECKHTPTCFILSTEDTRVCNETAKSVAAELDHPMNEVNYIVGGTHENVNFDEPYLIQNVAFMRNFCDKILAAAKAKESDQDA